MAYLAAAAVGPMILLLAIWAAEGFGDLAGSLLFVCLGFAFATVFAAPIALPTIIVSEARGISGWWFFAAAGTLGGLLMIVILAEFPLGLQDLPEIAAVMGASVTAASVYWWLAGRWAGPAPLDTV